MADDLMKNDCKSAENASSHLRQVLEEELNRYFAQLDAMLVEQEDAQRNEYSK